MSDKPIKKMDKQISGTGTGLESVNFIVKVIGGARRHESLSQAASYALLMESEQVANLLHDKLIERNLLVNKLLTLHVESDGTLLDGVPAQDGLASFMAIEDLAKTDPGLHPILGEIAALEKLKYMAGMSVGAAH